jgi:signal transduction histidine kinase
VSFAGAAGAIAAEARALGIRSSVGCPIVVAGRLWGVMAASTKSDDPFPPNIEAQIANFTELVATSIENAEARAELSRVADQQAALRRVATLVAEGAAPDPAFAAVVQEVGRLIEADVSVILRFDSDGTGTILARCGPNDEAGQVGGRWKPEPPWPIASVLATGESARADTDNMAPDDQPEFLRDGSVRVRSAIAVPITVEGRIWGTISVLSCRDPFPVNTEQRLAEFTELIATAIANSEARDELRRVASEQAALRRVATLVARGLGPEHVFAAVAEEVGTLIAAEATAVVRFEPDGGATFMGGHGWAAQAPPGTRYTLPPRLAIALVRATGRAARSDIDNPITAILPGGEAVEGIRSAVGAPIAVDGRLWGAIGIVSRVGPLPADAERRMTDFTELLATAIANAEAYTKLMQSRARIVTTADETRRRIERDLHDGAQQRLVSLALALRMAQRTVPAQLPGVRASIGQAAEDLTAVLDELREISRGLHPAILSTGGLTAALRTLARRSAVPVKLVIETDARYPAPIEIAAYYVVSEALTNAAKHADASQCGVVVQVRDSTLWLTVSDDGVGGAQPRQGSGLTGLRDRIEALGGSVHIVSPVRRGTTIQASLPIDPKDVRSPPDLPTEA